MRRSGLEPSGGVWGELPQFAAKNPSRPGWAGRSPLEERRGGGSGGPPLGFLGGAGVRPRQQVIGGLLGVAGGGEDRPLVVRQHLEP